MQAEDQFLTRTLLITYVLQDSWIWITFDHCVEKHSAEMDDNKSMTNPDWTSHGAAAVINVL